MHSPFRIDLVVRLFPLSKYTYGIIGLASVARTGSIALSENDELGRGSGVGGIPTFDFFSLHRSHALHTLLRVLVSSSSGEE